MKPRDIPASSAYVHIGTTFILNHYVNELLEKWIGDKPIGFVKTITPTKVTITHKHQDDELDYKTLDYYRGEQLVFLDMLGNLVADDNGYYNSDQCSDISVKRMFKSLMTAKLNKIFLDD